MSLHSSTSVFEHALDIISAELERANGSRSTLLSRLQIFVNEQSGVEPLQGFDLFWDVFPKLHGTKGSKPKAQDTWKKLKLDDRRAAWRGARNLALSIQAGIDVLPPHASTFLNQRRWDDWAEPRLPEVKDRIVRVVA